MTGPRIYNLFPLLAGSIDRWQPHLERIAAMQFDWIYVNPIFETGGSRSLYAVRDYLRLDERFATTPARKLDEVRPFLQAAAARELRVMIDLVANHTANDSPLVSAHPEWYVHDEDGAVASPFAVDPADTSKKTVWGDLAELDWSERPVRAEIVRFYCDVVQRYLEAGFRGFRCDAAYKIPGAVWGEIIAAARSLDPHVTFAAETLGAPLATIEQLAGAGFDYLFNSAKWWDFSAQWLLEQYEQFRSIAPSIAFPESHDTPRLRAELQAEGIVDREAVERAYEFRYTFAAVFSSGVMMPMGYEYGFAEPLHVVDTTPSDWEQPLFDLSERIAAVNAMKAATPALNVEGPQRRVSIPTAWPLELVREAQDATQVVVLLVNPDPEAGAAIPVTRALALADDAGAGVDAKHLVELTPAAPVPLDGTLEVAAQSVRVFASTRNGTTRAALPAPPAVAARAGLSDAYTDRSIVIEDIYPEVDSGRYPVKRIVWDTFDVWADIFKEGHDAVAAVLLYRAVDEPEWRESPFALYGNDRWHASFLLDRNIRYQYTIEAWTAQFADRRDAVRYDRILEVVCDRAVARFGAWYEMFPRSAGTDPARSATFAQAELRLTDIAAMGFDVVYLPPIHPIGYAHRKGRNNALEAAPGDPGSPWAIGNADGGHTAIDPGLGTLDDFRRFVATARNLGLEVALDYALQTSPDHPYVKAHPEWFTFRPDGTIQYAENPPKKYEDIVNFNWASPAREALWNELRDVVLFWVDAGVRIFRVDNPHTKPVPFWQWMIREVQTRHPDVIFLSEAFTRPKMMRMLAKAGFSQSYTYFTWRNAKQELIDYLVELTQSDVREYFRPNFFANTPDILTPYLQVGGRAAFLVRLTLAATLASAYGIYSGFELLEHEAAPGREEYADSEKYAIKVRDWDAPGNIKAEIAAINRIRRENPALHQLLNLRFYYAGNEQVLWYGKATAERDNIILVAVNLDPFARQESDLEVPRAQLDLPEGPVEVEELLSGERRTWAGATAIVAFDPQRNPVEVYRVVR